MGKRVVTTPQLNTATTADLLGWRLDSQRVASPPPDKKNGPAAGTTEPVKQELTRGSLAMNTSEVLYRAADLIEKRGWTTDVGGWPGFDDTLDANSSPLCIEGAIMAALGLTAHDGENVAEIDECPAGAAVRRYLNITTGYLFMWNDECGRTVGEVIEVLRSAAVIEAAREESEARA